MNVGIVGLGVTGLAVKSGFKGKAKIKYYDKKNPDSTINHCLDTDVCFICVPTPTVNTKQDLTQVDITLRQLDFANYKGIVAIKSTVLPGSTERYRIKYPGLHIIHNPEFLTERFAEKEFKDQRMAILGGPSQYCEIVSDLYKKIGVKSKVMDSTQAEMIKYMANVFFATKLTIMNEFNDLCRSLKIDYDECIKTASEATGWINEKHISVPGPDGLAGWGGKCFPKDVMAMIQLAKQLGIKIPTIETSYYANIKRRPNALRECA